MSAQPDLRSTSMSRRQRRDRTARALSAVAQTSSERRRQELLDYVVRINMGVARTVAGRYFHRGIDEDDLIQVAYMALTRAARDFDASRHQDFLSYAVPTIRGELRKHFRDHGWMIRPPRRIQELQARISVAESELSNKLGRSPQPVEIADHLDEPIESVIEALASDGCFVPASLDHPTGVDGATTLGDLLPFDDAEHRASEARLVLRPVLRELGERDRQILNMRFYEGLTQREIASRIGVTQMQVSRLLTRILAQLRQGVGELGTQEQEAAG